MSEALRFNEGKPALSYILQFVNPMKAIARIMEFGATKYEDGNWRKGGKPDKEYLDSMMRHLTSWLEGEVHDTDSGCSHLGHAIWNLLALHELNHPDEIMDKKVFNKQCEHWNNKKVESAQPTVREIEPAQWQIDEVAARKGFQLLDSTGGGSVEAHEANKCDGECDGCNRCDSNIPYDEYWDAEKIAEDDDFCKPVQDSRMVDKIKINPPPITFSLGDMDKSNSFQMLEAKYIYPAMLQMAKDDDAEWLSAYDDYFLHLAEEYGDQEEILREAQKEAKAQESFYGMYTIEELEIDNKIATTEILENEMLKSLDRVKEAGITDSGLYHFKIESGRVCTALANVLDSKSIPYTERRLVKGSTFEVMSSNHWEKVKEILNKNTISYIRVEGE